MKRNIIKKSKGFTLIELLIVIGILAVLAVTLLLALNPAEAQKRTRDAKRLRDAATLQSIISQYLESGQPIPATSYLNVGVGTNSLVSGIGNASQPCAASSNWLGINACPFAQTVPVDPNNGQSRTFVKGAAPPNDTFIQTTQYFARVVGSDYEIDINLEAVANRVLLTTDGGANASWGNDSHREFYEVFSGPANLL